MRFADLSPEDQRLLNTDLGDFEKEAQAQLVIADEMYSTGFNKLAAETADYLDDYFAKLASDESAIEEISLDAENEKVAQELGAFLEKGYTDGLMKLGQERHGDPLAYLLPFIEEKLAAKGAQAMLHRFGKKMKGFGKEFGKKMEAGKKAVGKGAEKVKEYHRGAAKEVSKGVKSLKKGKYSEGAKSVGKGGGKLVGPYAALAGGAALAHHATKKD